MKIKWKNNFLNKIIFTTGCKIILSDIFFLYTIEILAEKIWQKDNITTSERFYISTYDAFQASFKHARCLIVLTKSCQGQLYTPP